MSMFSGDYQFKPVAKFYRLRKPKKALWRAAVLATSVKTPVAYTSTWKWADPQTTISETDLQFAVQEAWKSGKRSEELKRLASALDQLDDVLFSRKPRKMIRFKHMELQLRWMGAKLEW